MTSEHRSTSSTYLKKHELNLKREIERIDRKRKELENQLESLNRQKRLLQTFCEHRLRMPTPPPPQILAEGGDLWYECLVCGLVDKRK